MKIMLLCLVFLIFLGGCSAAPGELQHGLDLRSKLLNATAFSFDADIIADYGDKLHQFSMTCCADDITYAGLACDWSGAATLNLRDWVVITAKISIGSHKIYGRKGPVLTVLDLAHSSKPEEEVATFY